MDTIGFIGAGNIGSTVARLAVDAGFRVLMSNRRGPESLVGLITELGPLAEAVTPAEAAARGDLVVVTVPLLSIDDLPATELAGKTFIDTNNYYPERDGHIEALESRDTTTSEMVRDRLPHSVVVKALNNIVYLHLAQLARPKAAPDRSTLPIAGDSPEAKATVTTFLTAVGYDVLDAGNLAEGWRFERGQPVYCLPYAADPEAMRGSTPGSRPADAAPASRDIIARLLEQAT